MNLEKDLRWINRLIIPIEHKPHFEFSMVKLVVFCEKVERHSCPGVLHWCGVQASNLRTARVVDVRFILLGAFFFPGLFLSLFFFEILSELHRLNRLASCSVILILEVFSGLMNDGCSATCLSPSLLSYI